MNKISNDSKTLIVGGRYVPIKQIGAGGMQQVFEADDLSLKRRVALKKPVTESAMKRFDRSAKLSARVVHPNVAATLDYVKSETEEFLIEELIKGMDLQQRFNRDFFAWDAHLSAHVLHHLAKGVAAAHHADVIHRDLKPSNIMVSDDPQLNTIKITDFGIAKMAGEVLRGEIEELNRDSTTITGSKTLVGAIPFMAPEALKQLQSLGAPSDVWALGAIGYWLVAGVAPFGTGLTAIAGILGTDNPKRPGSFGIVTTLKPLEDQLWAVIQHCLRREPNKRPSIDELVKLLSNLCYSTKTRLEGVVNKVGTPKNKNACFISVGQERYFFHVNSFLGFGNRAAVGQRVNFSAFRGRPHDRAGLVVLMRDLPAQAE